MASHTPSIEKCALAKCLFCVQLTVVARNLRGSPGNIFTRQHLAVLHDAIEALAAGGKNGLKMNLKAIIMRTIQSLKGMYAEAMAYAKCRELDMFTGAYTFLSHGLFATAL